MDKDEKIKALEEELHTTKELLKKYTASSYSREYYEKNKDTIKERNANYKKNTKYNY